MLYSQQLLDHYENPRNVGSLNEQAKNVGIGLVGDPAYGNVMQLHIEVDQKLGKIIDAKFKTFGRVATIAAGSLATELLIYQNIVDANKITNEKIAQELSFSLANLDFSLLAEEAIKSAINNYQTKNIAEKNLEKEFVKSAISHSVVNYLAISVDAAKQITYLLQNRSESCQGIRVAVRTRGCSGLSYTIEYAIAEKNITKFDDVVIYNQNEMQFNLYIDPKASMFLIGSEMIFKKDDLSSGFDFINPNEKGRSGCGESFKA